MNPPFAIRTALGARAGRVLLIAIVLCLGLWSRPATAADACASLFASTSPHLQLGSCNFEAARQKFVDELPLRCTVAAYKGRADESMGKLQAIVAAADRTAPCATERWQLALYALCTMHPPNHRDWLLTGLAEHPLLWRPEHDEAVRSACLQAALEEPPHPAISAALQAFVVHAPNQELPIDVLARVLSRVSPRTAEPLAPLLREANRLELRHRDRFHKALCSAHEELPQLSQTVCAETFGDEELRAEQHARWEFSRKAQQEAARFERRDRAKRIGLSMMSIGLAGLQVGLSIPFRNQLGGKVVATIGGIAAGNFTVIDAAYLNRQPCRNCELSLIGAFFAGIPGGIIGYASTYDPTALSVFSAMHAAFSLSSALALTWTN